jgi:hypothetical protein
MPTVIGLLHSSAENKFRDPLEDGLQDGGLNPGAGYTIHHRLGGNYDANDIENKARSIPNPDVVVVGGTFAGLIAATVVWPDDRTVPENQCFPLFVVAGRDDKTFFDRRRTGGYTLEPSPAGPSLNKLRVQRLNDSARYNIALANICLLYNKNSAMSDGEVKNWGSISGNLKLYNAAAADGSAKSQRPNDQIDFAAAMLGAAATIGNSGAIVVSADPFFTQKRKLIVKAARSLSNIVMCYPIFDYFIGSADKSRAMIMGPLVDELYYNIGLQIAYFVSKKSFQGMQRAPYYYFGKELTTRSFWSTLFGTSR